MRIELFSDYDSEDIEVLKDNYCKKYGTIDLLRQKIMTEKCSVPLLSDEYLVWSSLNANATLRDSIVFFEAEIIDALTQKRVELLEFILSNNIDSITELSKGLKRNYKN